VYTKEKLIIQFKKKKKLKFIFFWKPVKTSIIDESCLSQWFPAQFKKNEYIYKTAEHYMMAEKARLFDESMVCKILNAKTTKEVKNLGRIIKNFDEELWKEKAFDIVVEGNYLKFSQNKKLKEYLLSTKDKILVEASPYDKIWGIGLAKGDKAKNPLMWNGENKLGFALMKTRDMLSL